MTRIIRILKTVNTASIVPRKCLFLGNYHQNSISTSHYHHQYHHSFHSSCVYLNNNSEPTGNKSQTNWDILSLVPNKGRVGIIDLDGKFSSNVNLKKFLTRQFDENNCKLIVVKFSHHHQRGAKAGTGLLSEDGEEEASVQLLGDPAIVCKVIPLVKTGEKDSRSGSPPHSRTNFPAASQSGFGENTNKWVKLTKPKKPKPTAIKDIPISWNIALSDLASQKKQAIQSVLTRGHTLQLQLDSKPGSRYPRQLSPLEIEKRNLLIEKCHELCSELGTELHKPQGSIVSKVTLFYGPKKHLA